jgi:hypothetical protein
MIRRSLIAQEKPKFDVFLSHNSTDKPWVSEFKGMLERKGLRVWLDKDEIRPGDLFAKALEHGISSSKAVAIIVSPESLASSWVEEEYYRALSLANSTRQNLRLIPILLRGADLPAFLSSRHWIDCRQGAALDDVADQLIWGISGQRGSCRQGENPVRIVRSVRYAAIAVACAIITLSLLNTFTSVLSGIVNFRLRFIFIDLLLILLGYIASRILFARRSDDGDGRSVVRNEYLHIKHVRTLAASALIAAAATLLSSSVALRHFHGRQGSVQGRVVGQGGVPVAGVLVDAVNVDGRSVCRAAEITDSFGRFVLDFEPFHGMPTYFHIKSHECRTVTAIRSEVLNAIRSEVDPKVNEILLPHTCTGK